jgi:hypothetical protein
MARESQVHGLGDGLGNGAAKGLGDHLAQTLADLVELGLQAAQVAYQSPAGG